MTPEGPALVRRIMAASGRGEWAEALEATEAYANLDLRERLPGLLAFVAP